MSDILVHGGNSNVARRQSALQLKNFLSSNDEATRHLYQQRWLALPDTIRNYIKTNVVGALGSETYRPSAAAQCVQYIAVFELPNALWPNLIQVQSTFIVRLFFGLLSRCFEGNLDLFFSRTKNYCIHPSRYNISKKIDQDLKLELFFTKSPTYLGSSLVYYTPRTQIYGSVL